MSKEEKVPVVKTGESGEKKEKEKKPTIFSMIIDSLREGPKTTDQLADIIAKGSTKMSGKDQAKKTVPVRIYNLKKAGYDIEGSAKEGTYSLKGEPK